MKIKKTIDRMKTQLGSQLAERVQNIDLDSVLSAIGLQVAKPTRSSALPMLAAFGSGIVVGTLFAQMPGTELRAKLMARMSRKKSAKSLESIDDSALTKSDGEATESPYDKAKSQRENSDNGQRKGMRPMEVKNPGVNTPAT